MPDNVLSLDAFRPRPAQTPFDTGQADLDPGSGALISVLPDGNVLIDLNPQMRQENYEGAHDGNLAEVLSDGDLGWISTQLLEGVEEDERSRRQWLKTCEEGLKLLGFKLEAPRGDAGSSGAPLEGMSTV
jgi:hypothetical protein